MRSIFTNKLNIDIIGASSNQCRKSQIISWGMMSIPLTDKIDHIRFVEDLMKYACNVSERLNYERYLKALRSNLLDSHQGRYVYIVDGMFLNKSFEFAHEVIDHLIASGNKTGSECLLFNNATFIYVPRLSGNTNCDFSNE